MRFFGCARVDQRAFAQSTFGVVTERASIFEWRSVARPAPATMLTAQTMIAAAASGSSDALWLLWAGALCWIEIGAEYTRCDTGGGVMGWVFPEGGGGGASP